MNSIKRIICINEDDSKSEYIGENLSVAGKEQKVHDNHIFDFCVKQSFIASPYMGTVSLKHKPEYGFYLSKYNTFYDRYFSKEMKLEELLVEEIRECYAPTRIKKTTSGNEFTSGKFYSVASSSRLAVSSFTKEKEGLLNYINTIKLNNETATITEIQFEHDTPVTGIPEGKHCPQMDVFMKTDKGTVFVEVKNHEILDGHKSIELSPGYANTGAFRKLGCSFTLEEKVKKDKEGKDTSEKYLTLKGNTEKNRFLLASDFNCNLETYHFDFKQFLCHLMGILSYSEKNPEEEIYFYYLVYKNELYVEEYKSELYKELEKEVNEVLRVFRERFPKIHFGLCYNNKYDTLGELKDDLSK